MLDMTFSQKVLNLRDRRGWSQKDLAREITKVSGSAVSGWERGAIPAMDAAFRLARLFGLSLDDLADDTKDLPTERLPAEASDPMAQLMIMIERYGAARIYWRLMEVGMVGANTSTMSVVESRAVQGEPVLPEGDPRASGRKKRSG